MLIRMNKYFLQKNPTFKVDFDKHTIHISKKFDQFRNKFASDRYTF